MTFLRELVIDWSDK